MSETEEQAAIIENLAAQENDTESGGGEWTPPEQPKTMQEELEEMPAEELARSFLHTTFSLLAGVRGNHWIRHEVLINNAAREYGAMIDRNRDIIKLPAWSGLAWVSGALVIPPALVELQMWRERRARREEEAELHPQEEKQDKGLDDGD